MNVIDITLDNFSKPTSMVERDRSVDSHIQYDTQDQAYTYDKRDENSHTQSLQHATSATYKNIILTPTDPTIPMVDSIPISTSITDIPATGNDRGTDNYHTQYRSYVTQDENYHAPGSIHENRMLTSNSRENIIFTPLDKNPAPTSEQYTPSNELPNKCELTTRCEPEPTVDDSIHMNRKIYLPPLESVYIEPDFGPDLLEGMQLLYQQYGKSLRQQVAPLPPRDDIIDFNMSFHGTELDKNLIWDQCPDSAKSPIMGIIKEYWDVFCEEGLRNNIRGFIFRVDTGKLPTSMLQNSPVWPPRNWPH